MTAASPIAPPMTPPIASTFPAPLFAEAVVLALVVVAVPVEELAAADAEEVEAGTLEGIRVPQVLQAEEPGLAIRHCAKVCSQMKLGTVPWYWSIFEGLVPLSQVHWYWRRED